jgi:hypothetical protein
MVHRNCPHHPTPHQITSTSYKHMLADMIPPCQVPGKARNLSFRQTQHPFEPGSGTSGHVDGGLAVRTYGLMSLFWLSVERCMARDGKTRSCHSLSHVCSCLQLILVWSFFSICCDPPLRRLPLSRRIAALSTSLFQDQSSLSLSSTLHPLIQHKGHTTFQSSMEQLSG